MSHDRSLRRQRKPQPKSSVATEVPIGESNLPLIYVAAKQLGLEYWLHRRPRCRTDRDPEISSFLRDRIGRLTLDAMLPQCRERFPPARVPSRSAIHRWAFGEGAHRKRLAPAEDRRG